LPPAPEPDGPLWHSLTDAVVAGDGRGVDDALVGLLAARPAGDVARGALALLLPRQGWEMQGSKRTHAVLTTCAAAWLADREGDEVGRPAVVNALHFLTESPPTRRRPTEPVAEAPELRAALRAGHLAGAEAALAGLDGEALEAAWFGEAWRSVEGWGHRGIAAASLWALEGRLAPTRDDRGRALLRQWLPWVDDPGQGAVERLADERGLPDALLATGAGPADPGPVEALAEACLVGDGATVLAGALASGVPPETAVWALVVGACRLLRERGGLQQLHALTAGHALVAAMRPGVDLRPGIVGVLALLEEAWQAPARSGRLDPQWGRGALSSRPSPAVDEVDAVVRAAVKREATPSFGHAIKASRTALELAEQLPAPLDAWPRDALLATAGTWPGMQRAWLRVRRRLD
jgi:hypothetical protein